ENDRIIGELKPMDAPQSYSVPTAAAGYFYSEELGVILELSVREDELWMYSAQHGLEKLLQQSAFSFTCASGLVEQLTFLPTKTGAINTISLDLSSRARNLQFQRWQLIVKD
ncbi:MAG: hypothetical protein AAF840_18130, partial [Bacteroidota bacterium]